MDGFTPGLEGVVAVETEIAEPDRDGGALRYRGVDIRELVGAVPFERVWGLLVDGTLGASLDLAGAVPLATGTGEVLADLQSATAALAGHWKLGKLIDIDAGGARADLERISVAMIDIVARLATGDVAAAGIVGRSGSLAERFLTAWRGEARPHDVRALDTYWICTAEHGLNA